MTSSLDGVVPIVAQDMPSIITSRLKQMIAEGALEPGAQLTESALARAFGVSRGPVREAIQRLTQEGLLVSEHNRGTYVPVLARADVEDIYVIRGALETAAIELLIRNGAEEALIELDHMLDELQSAVSAEEYGKADTLDLDFHRRLVYLSGSPRLTHAIDRISIESIVCLRMLKFSHPSHPDIVDWHRHIVDAIRARDVRAAREAVNFHNYTVLRDLFDEKRDGPSSEEPSSTKPL